MNVARRTQTEPQALEAGMNKRWERLADIGERHPSDCSFAQKGEQCDVRWLLDEVASMERAVLRYGKHDGGCSFGRTGVCLCGFDVVLSVVNE